MNFYPETFLSYWHLLAVGIAIVAFLRYKNRELTTKNALMNTLRIFLGVYVAITFILAFIVDGGSLEEKRMLNGLDKTYEIMQEEESNRYMTSYVGSFPEDDAYVIKIYIGNYSDEDDFTGDFEISMMGEDGDVLTEKEYTDISVEPGEKYELDEVKLDNPVYDTDFTFNKN